MKITNSNIVRENCNALVIDDIAVMLTEMLNTESMYLLVNPMPHTEYSEATSKQEPFSAIGSAKTDEELPYDGKLMPYIVNAHMASRLQILLSPYITLPVVETAHGPALALRSPRANVLTADEVARMIELRFIPDMEYSAITVDAYSLEPDEDSCEDDYYAVGVIEPRLTPEEDEKYNTDMEGDWTFPIGVITNETLAELRERYSSGIIGSMEDDKFAFRRK